MKKNLTSADDLKTIRKIMEESTKFLSLSGFSGVFLGIFAILGALVAWVFILDNGSIKLDEYYTEGIPGNEASYITLQLMIDACSVLVLSLLSAFYFSFIKAKRSGKRFWTPVSKRLFSNLLIPLVSGGTFVIILLFQNHIQLIIPGLLIFYGLALVNVGKFTYDEIFYLGTLEIITGLVSSFFPAAGLIFWIFGFGILHIIYGIFMYRKYEV